MDRELTNLIAQFSAQASWPRTMPLEDQGRFAISFYYERAPKSGEPVADDNPTNDDSNKF